jgi:YHS domain-containing protein
MNTHCYVDRVYTRCMTFYVLHFKNWGAISGSNRFQEGHSLLMLTFYTNNTIKYYFLGNLIVCEYTYYYMILLIKYQELEKYKSRDKLPIKCKNCHNKFYTTKNNVQKVLSKKHGIKLDFCSTKCSGLFKRKKIKINCSQCHKKIEVLPSQLKKSKHGKNFCNKSCAAIFNNEHRILNRPNKSCYRKQALKKLTNECLMCGYKKHIPVLQIHHKDKDRTNNKISNLEVLCPTCHTEKHFLEKTGTYHNMN